MTSYTPPAILDPRDRHVDYFPLFDWLRGILALVVMLTHERLIPWPHAGNLAVQVFFALSGWLIGGILLELSTSDLPRFYFNRVARIWAPYYAALALLLGVSILKDPINRKWMEFVFYKFTFVYNLFGPPQLAHHRMEMPLDGTGNHFWTINVEEQFYLIAPLVLVALAPKVGRSIWTWLVICAVCWIVWFRAPAPITAPAIPLGVIAALIAHRRPTFHLTKLVRLTMLLVFVIASAAMFAKLSFIVFAPLFAISTVMLLAIRGPQNAIGALVGGVSYPFYLNHWTGGFIAHAALKPFGLRDSGYAHALSIVSAIALSTAMYFMIDRPVLRRRAQVFTPGRAVLARRLAYGILIAGLLVSAWLYHPD